MAFKFLLVVVLAAIAVGIPANRSSGQNKLMSNMDQKSPHVLGDIRLVDWQLEETKGAFVNNSTKYWPGGRIPYYMSTAFSATALVAIQEALAHYNMNTCIRFVPRTPLDKNYIHIIKGDDCDSNLGMVGGEQTVILGEGCYRRGMILHVLGQAIGLLDEHTRSDRDKYVEIRWDNIPEVSWKEFQRRDERNERICNKSYDCSSIMHSPMEPFDGYGGIFYPKYDNCTMEFNSYASRLSKLDIDTIKCMYCS